MNVTFACPKCEATTRQAWDGQPAWLRCVHCEAAWPIPAAAPPEQPLTHCLVCQNGELFVRKDFSQRLGIAIVVLGFGISCITWYFYWIYATFAVLFATALIDVLLYLLVPNLLQCYRCGAEYRGVPGLEQHSPFRLETHERYRQEAARLGEP